MERNESLDLMDQTQEFMTSCITSGATGNDMANACCTIIEAIADVEGKYILLGASAYLKQKFKDSACTETTII